MSRQNVSLTQNSQLFDVPTAGLLQNKCRGLFLDHHLQPVVKGVIYNVMNTQNLLEKLKHLGKVPSNATVVKADAVILYPSMPHNACLKDLYEKLDKMSY